MSDGGIATFPRTTLGRLLLLVALIGITPFPKRLGFYKHLFAGLHPGLVGMFPCSVPREDDWGFTLHDLYEQDLQGQRALVTGANSGMGLELSLALARLGAEVTLACRNPVKCEAAADTIRKDARVRERYNTGTARTTTTPNLPIHTATVDLSSLESVRRFGSEFVAHSLVEDRLRPLDMVFFNAGILVQPPLEDGSPPRTVDGIESVFATNVVGHHLLYRWLEPLLVVGKFPGLVRTTPARIVLTSSAASYHTFPRDEPVPTTLESLHSDQPNTLGLRLYAQSKLAQILWAKELTAQLDENNKEDPNSVVYVNAAHPGAVATNLIAEWDTILTPLLGRKLATVVTHGMMKLATTVLWTPQEGALTLLYLGTAVHDLHDKTIRGQYFHPQSVRMVDHPLALDKDAGTQELQERLWKFLDDLVADFVV